VAHVEGRDFSAVIERALRASRLRSRCTRKSVRVGFMRNALLAHAETIIEL